MALGCDQAKSISLRRQMSLLNNSSIHFRLVWIVSRFMIDQGTNSLIYAGMTFLTVCPAQWKQHDVWTRWSMRMRAFGNRCQAGPQKEAAAWPLDRCLQSCGDTYDPTRPDVLIPTWWEGVERRCGRVGKALEIQIVAYAMRKMNFEQTPLNSFQIIVNKANIVIIPLKRRTRLE